MPPIPFQSPAPPPFCTLGQPPAPCLCLPLKPGMFLGGGGGSCHGSPFGGGGSSKGAPMTPAPKAKIGAAQRP